MTCCGLTEYGRRELAILSVGVLADLVATAIWVRPVWLCLSLASVSLAVWVWALWFFRDPERCIPGGEGLLVAPADGCVTDITPLGPQSLLGREGVQVGIFMSVFDVHVNRSPADGVVVKVEHRDGTFLDVRRQEAWERNESATIFLQVQHRGQALPLIFRQIAGLIARRIVTDIAPGQSLARGQRMGMIKFGSRVEVLAPRELAGEIRVRVGQHVKAGLTILAAANERT